VEGSTAVVGPDPPGPIKKLKNPTELKMNNKTRPKIAIDNHSPALNIFYICIFKIEYFNIVKD
jgi:hypothetical protein